MTLRIVSAADIDAVVGPTAAVDAMRIAFRGLSTGTANVPIRAHLDAGGGLVLLMPAHLGESAGLGAKIVSVFPENPSSGLPAILGAVILLDAATGRPKALLDGTRLTAIRTAAGSGLAVELLADPAADVLAVFGAGVQGRSHVEIIAGTRRLAEIRIVSRSGASATALAERLNARLETLVPPGADVEPPRVVAISDPTAALRDAGIVIAATTSTTPVFASADLEDGAHVSAVGSFRPDMQEVYVCTLSAYIGKIF